MVVRFQFTAARIAVFIVTRSIQIAAANKRKTSICYRRDRMDQRVFKLTRCRSIPASAIYSHLARISDARCRRHVAPASPAALPPFGIGRRRDGIISPSRTGQAPICKQWLGVLCQALIRSGQTQIIRKSGTFGEVMFATHLIFGLTLLITVPQFSTGQCVPVRMCWIRQLRQTEDRKQH